LIISPHIFVDVCIEFTVGCPALRLFKTLRQPFSYCWRSLCRVS